MPPNLSGLSLKDDLDSDVPLSPSFTAGTTAYNASVINTVASITVTSAVTNSAYTVKVNGAPLSLTGSGVLSGTSGAITLVTGDNSISVTVSYGTTTTPYTVTVTKAP